MIDMESMLSDYINERLGQTLVTSHDGFYTYTQQDKVLVIGDMYVKPASRRQGKGLGFIRKIAEKAKELGCNEVVGFVYNQANNHEDIETAAKAIGFVHVESDAQCSMFRMEL